MANIYDQHDKAFARVSAYVIARDGKRVATVAFKRPPDGAGRLQVFVHWIGSEMVRGYAGGCGYDKHSAACACAARSAGAVAWPAAFRDALVRDEGASWNRELECAGFAVWSAC